MKILLVNTRHFYGGGDSTYTFNLADLLKSKGHEVAFFGMQDERNLPDPNSDLFVSHIDFRDLSQHKDPITGLKVLARSIYSIEARRKFAYLLDRFQPDIVHLQNIHAHLTPSVIFEAKKMGLPVVWTLHDYKLVCPNSHFLIDKTGQVCESCRGGRFYQAGFKRCKKASLLASSMAALEAYAHSLMGVRNQVDAFLAPSAFLRNKLLENGFRPQKVHHLPLFVPADLFNPADSDQGYLLFLGRVEAIKGILPLIEACRLAPQVKVVIAGRAEEPLSSRLASLLPSNACYVGLKSGEELKELRRNALALVLPSIWYENQPFSILEAFAAGKPVIASDLGGMTELVADHQRGLLVPARDAAALAKAMIWVYMHPFEARELGQEAYRYVLINHSPERHYQSLMKIYQSFL